MTADRPARRGPGRHDRVGQVGAGPGGWPGAAGDVELVSVDSMCGLPGDGHRHGQARRRGAGRGAAPPARPGRPGRGVHRRRASRRAAAGRAGRDRGPGAPGPAGRGDRALPAGGGRRARAPRAASPRWPPTLEAEAADGPEGVAVLHARLAGLDPVAAGADHADQPPAGRAGPRGDARLGRAPSPRSAPAWPPTRPRPSPCSGSASTPAVVDRRHRRALRRRWLDAGAAGRGARPWPPGPAACRAPPARPSATASCWPTSRRASRSRTAWTRPAPHPGLRPAPVGLVPARPPDPLAGARRGPLRGAGRGPRRWCAEGPDRSVAGRGMRDWETWPRRTASRSPAHQAPGGGQRLPGAWSTPTTRRPSVRRPGPRPVRPPPRPRGRRRHPGRAGPGAPTLSMELRNADGARPR